MQASPLAGHLEAAHATTELAGVEIAEHFGDAVKEAAGTRSGAGVVDLSHRAWIAVRGDDRTSFLQGQLTNDVAHLRAGQGCYAALLNHKGKLRGDVRVSVFDDHVLLSVEGAERQRLPELLGAFVIMEDVRFEQRSAAAVGVYGPAAPEHLAALLDAGAVAELGEGHWIARGELTLIGDPSLGLPGTTVVGSPAAVGALLEALLARGVLRLGEAGYEIIRIEAGTPRWGLDMDQDTIPIEAGLTRAISYTKGCYTGQETIARIKTYGHVNRRLMGLELQTPASRGQALIHEGRRVGIITSTADSAVLQGPIALGMLRREVAAPGTRLGLESSDASALVRELPFAPAAAPDRA